MPEREAKTESSSSVVVAWVASSLFSLMSCSYSETSDPLALRSAIVVSRYLIQSSASIFASSYVSGGNKVWRTASMS